MTGGMMPGGMEYSLCFKERWARKFFWLVRKSQNRKFWGSFRNRKLANFWGVPVHKSQLRKFLLINPQTFFVSQSANCKSTNLQGRYHILYKLVTIGLISIKNLEVKGGWSANKFCKSQIRKLPQLWKVRKSKIKSANFRICDLWNLFAYRPPFTSRLLITMRPIVTNLYVIW
jgi:hypothetical protein